MSTKQCKVFRKVAVVIVQCVLYSVCHALCSGQFAVNSFCVQCAMGVASLSHLSLTEGRI